MRAANAFHVLIADESWGAEADVRAARDGVALARGMNEAIGMNEVIGNADLIISAVIRGSD